MKRLISNIITLILTALVFLLCNWLFLPVVKVTAFSLIFTVSIIMFIVSGIISMFMVDSYDEGAPWICMIASVLLFVYGIILAIASGAMTNANTYHTSYYVEDATEETTLQLPTIEEIEKISLMDSASAAKLGDRTLGSLAEYVSQYEVSNKYYTIAYKGQIVKVAPLEYGGVFKAFANETIPGYVIVYPNTNKAEFVKVDKGIKYSPSDICSQDLMRYVHNAFPAEYLGDYSFQIDEEANVYWVITTLETLTTSSCKVPYGCILVNATNGKMTKYDSLEEIPTWVDLVYSGETVEALYNRYGKYINGYWNFSKTGVTATTDDYGYLMVGEDIYIYTGITSAGRDESNLGFILANSRTGECIYYPISGAEEYSAMGAAEGLVQNFGYSASFPSLVLVEEEPTYVLVLKDANGLVKKYAMVNYENYTIAVAEDTLEKSEKAYQKALVTKNPESVEEDSTETETVVVESINFVVVDGVTICYVKGNSKVFRVSFYEELMLINVGDSIKITYVMSDDSILQAITIK